MDNVRDMGIEQIVDRLREYLRAADMGEVNATSLNAMRDIFGDIIAHRFGPGCDCPVVAEVLDTRREKAHIIRVPHAHRIRDSHTLDGASLSEVMESLDLMMLTASNAVRSVTAEISYQEQGREKQARHIAKCTGLRRWGESVADENPGLSRLLIRFAQEAVFPTVLDTDLAESLGFDPAYLQDLLDPSRIEDLTAHLCAMAHERGYD